MEDIGGKNEIIKQKYFCEIYAQLISNQNMCAICSQFSVIFLYHHFQVSMKKHLFILNLAPHTVSTAATTTCWLAKDSES